MHTDEVREIMQHHMDSLVISWTIYYDSLFYSLYNEGLNRGKVAEWLRTGLQNL